MQAGSVKPISKGYILIGMLVLMLVASYALTEASAKWSDTVKREREQTLLKVGDTYRKAIGSYYNQTPGIVKEYPPNLEVLVLDNRFVTPRRHIRKLYLDPVTQQAGWGLLQAPSGGIIGVYSLSSEMPIKRKSFRPIYKSFENQPIYGNWYFAYVPNVLPPNYFQ